MYWPGGCAYYTKGIYNAKTKIQGASLSQDGTTLNISSNLKAGHYYVNIVDANKKYRSPDFEGGLAEDGHYPYFIIKSNSNLGYNSAAKKLTVSDGDLANVYENVSTSPRWGTGCCSP